MYKLVLIIIMYIGCIYLTLHVKQISIFPLAMFDAQISSLLLVLHTWSMNYICVALGSFFIEKEEKAISVKTTATPKTKKGRSTKAATKVDKCYICFISVKKNCLRRNVKYLFNVIVFCVFKYCTLVSLALIYHDIS